MICVRSPHTLDILARPFDDPPLTDCERLHDETDVLVLDGRDSRYRRDRLRRNAVEPDCGATGCHAIAHTNGEYVDACGYGQRRGHQSANLRRIARILEALNRHQ